VQFLINFANENQEFQDILKRSSSYDTVQGLVLDLDRYWLLTWQMRQRSGGATPDRISRLIEILADWPLLFGPDISPSYNPGGLNWQQSIYSRPIEQSDIDDWRPPQWDRYQRSFGGRGDGLPIVVKVCLRPSAKPGEKIPTADDLRDSKGRLRVEIQTRPQAQLSSNPRRHHRPLPGGVSIGTSAKDFGTLGVILTDHRGKYYGLTCSHVAQQGMNVDQPAQRDRSGPSPIGKSILATALSPCSQTAPCNPWAGVAAHELDLSLVEIDARSVTSILEVLDIGPLSSIVPRAGLSTGQAVEVMGRTTRYSVLQVGGLAAWYRFHSDGKYYCFKNLFEVQSPYGSTSAIRPGDSGGPVCTADQIGTGWCGMIVGCDKFNGYAMYSETAEGWLTQNGYSLRLM
jgi:hypothetical protein